jgi:flagellar hook-associated protein 1 FlgK
MLDQQRFQAAGTLRYHEAMSAGLRVIDGEMADPMLSLDGGVNRLFEAVAALSRNPADAAAEATVVSEARLLASAILHVDDRLLEIGAAASEIVSDRVLQVNESVQELAAINAAIRRASDTNGASPALLDRRDALLMQVAEAVGGDIGVSEDGQARVYLGGVPLVEKDLVGHLVWRAGDSPTLLAEYPSINGVPGQTLVPVTGSLGGDIRAQIELTTVRDRLISKLPAAFQGLLERVREAAGQGPGRPGEAVLAYLTGGAAGDTAQTSADLVRQLASLKPAEQRQQQGVFLNPWRSLVSAVGVEARSQRTSFEAAQAVDRRLDAEWQSRSAVNLDEEAANLMRYQQSYAASSRVIQVYGQMLDEVLGMLR